MFSYEWVQAHQLKHLISALAIDGFASMASILELHGLTAEAIHKKTGLRGEPIVSILEFDHICCTGADSHYLHQALAATPAPTAVEPPTHVAEPRTAPPPLATAVQAPIPAPPPSATAVQAPIPAPAPPHDQAPHGQAPHGQVLLDDVQANAVALVQQGKSVYIAGRPGQYIYIYI